MGHTQVVDATEKTKQIRFLLSAGDSITIWHFRCRIREKMLQFMADHYPQHLPVQRANWAGSDHPCPPDGSGEGPSNTLAPLPMATGPA